MHTMNEDRCICCGEIIPEGRMVCPNCLVVVKEERGVSNVGMKCCYGCVPPKRHRACWSTCPDFKEEKEQDAEKKEAERKRRIIDAGIREQRSRSVHKALRRRKS